MGTLGYAAILLGALLLRQVIVGRARETPEDIRDLMVAVLRGDFDTVKEIASQRGTNIDGEAGIASASPSVSPNPSASGNQLVDTMRSLGSGKPYVFGAEGPNAYDCSGLVWAALRQMGIYNGPRFTAGTSFISASKAFATPVTTPAVGDIALWSGHHIGVVVGDDRMYSARSTAKGIGESSISGDSSYFGFKPTYYRLSNG